MKAFLLAGGYGTRLRPITNTVPKCLVAINDKPLLQYWLESLSRAGIDEFLINIHYLHEQVEEFIAGSQWRESVTLVYEPELRGTLGSVKHNADFFGEQDFLVAHADNFTDLDFSLFFQRHQSRPEYCDATMLLFRTDTPQSCGIVEVDENKVLSYYIEKPESDKYGNLANAAVFVFSPKSLLEIKQMPDHLTDLCKDYVPGLTGKINTYLHTGIMQDIGTIEALEKVRKNSLQQ